MNKEIHRETWPVLERVLEYDNDWYSGGYDRVIQPDGREKNYFWASLPDAVVVVARTGDELVFVKQYRPAIREWCWELPAGLVESDESFEQAGRRELAEETGFEASEVILMEEFWCSTGLLDHRRGMVFAEDLNEVATDRGQNEFISVEQVPVEKALSVARQSPANDATLEGILLAKEDGFLP